MRATVCWQAKLSRKLGEGRGARAVYNERTCSQCRHWDLKHVQRTELDDEAFLIEEYFSWCMNPKSPCKGRFVEAEDGCEAFEQR